jgi:hypothetical protein
MERKQKEVAPEITKLKDEISEKAQKLVFELMPSKVTSLNEMYKVIEYKFVLRLHTNFSQTHATLIMDIETFRKMRYQRDPDSIRSKKRKIESGIKEETLSEGIPSNNVGEKH